MHSILTSLTQPLSLSTNASPQKPISAKSNTLRNMAYYSCIKYTLLVYYLINSILLLLTAPNRQVFSRSAPTLPMNPSMNVMVPRMMSTKAGSRAINVSLLIFRNISFSVQAQMPTARTSRADIQMRTLLVKSKYFRQQLISLVSLRYLRTAGIFDHNNNNATEFDWVFYDYTFFITNDF